MTEKEKMIIGQPYISMDQELLKDRQKAKEIAKQINDLDPLDLVKRNQLFKEAFGEIGEESFIEPPCHFDYGYNIKVGKNFYANYNCVFLDCAPITIGDNTMLGPNVNLYTASHPIEYRVRDKGVEYAFPITIGSHVWIGGNTTILPGVSIGDNTVIGAGSVVTKDIPSNVVAVGNPCKVIKTLEK